MYIFCESHVSQLKIVSFTSSSNLQTNIRIIIYLGFSFMFYSIQFTKFDVIYLTTKKKSHVCLT